ncbi:MAG TPA: prepilin-type N-terminal cleavage/methylation domain-containing protein [Rickettsiales bacterium]|nr:prepilin-type N-terminal cleavage/methylation domain-containing protein [Rickettsiales bacterium]
MKKRFRAKRSAFSLIELSIVLIIIGLLIAGVTGGASLIKSSELRSIITEARSWAIAVNGFYNQFDALPGDYGTSVGLASTDGDGDGTIEGNGGGGTNVYEGRGAWIHLKSAGILDSTILSTTFTAVSAVAVTSFGGIIPASKIKASGWDFDYNTTSLQNVVVLTGAMATALSASSSNSFVKGTSIAVGAITPTDALAIDAKFDDGVANTGKIRGILSGCFSTTTYTTTDSDKECPLSYQIDVNS